MNLFWDIYWPLFTAGIIIGVVAGTLGFRADPAHRPKSREFRHRGGLWAAIGAAAALVLGGLWHGPLGAADRLASTVETTSRRVLVDWEMPQIQAHLERGPLTRTLVLSGVADDFQRSELVRIMNGVPGVARVRWSDMERPLALPLLAEAELAGLVCFSLGLLLSYLLELRRRYRAQWRW